VWTGQEIVVFGATPSDVAGRPPVRGAAFDPVTGAWRLLAPNALLLAPGTTSTWTGTHIVVVSGTSSTCPDTALCVAVAGAYEVASDTWRPVPPIPIAYGRDARVSTVWDGRAVVMMIAQPAATFAMQWDLVGPRWQELPAPVLDGNNRLVSDGATVIDIAWDAQMAKLQASIFDHAAGEWQRIAAVNHESECAARGVEVTRGALVFCSHEERLVLDLDTARWATLTRSPVPIEPGRWTGRELLAMSHDGQVLVRFMPAPPRDAETTTSKAASPTATTTATTTAPTPVGPAVENPIGTKVTSFGTSVQVFSNEQTLAAGAGEETATVDVEVCVAPPASTEYGGAVAFRLELADGRRLGAGVSAQHARDPRFGTVRIPAEGGCTRGFVAFAVPLGERPEYVVWAYDNFPETTWRVAR
jgi:hypothetical protein